MAPKEEELLAKIHERLSLSHVACFGGSASTGKKKVPGSTAVQVVFKGHMD